MGRGLIAAGSTVHAQIFAASASDEFVKRRKKRMTIARYCALSPCGTGMHSAGHKLSWVRGYLNIRLRLR